MQSPRDFSDADRWNIAKVFAVIGIIGLIIGWLFFFRPLHGPEHPRAQRRNQCMNNLKQIGLALHNYHDEYGSFPPAYIADENGRPMHSWRVLLLPFLDEKKLYNEYHFDEPWNGPHNVTLQDRIPEIYRCPEYQRDLSLRKISSEYSDRLTNYVAIDDPTAVFNGDQGSSLKEITDGTSNTIFVAEVHNHTVHWMQPEDITPEEFLQEFIASRDEAETNHDQGVHVLFADGAARSLKPEFPLERVKTFLTKSADFVIDGDPS